jgi:hypothetical protein
MHDVEPPGALEQAVEEFLRPRRERAAAVTQCDDQVDELAIEHGDAEVVARIGRAPRRRWCARRRCRR